MGAGLCSADFRQPRAPPPAPAASSRGSQLMCHISGGNIACAAVGNHVIFYQTSTVKKLKHLEGHSGPVTCLLAEDGLIFSGSVDKTIRKWDPKGTAALQTLEGHAEPVWCLTMASGLLFSGSQDKTIRQWDPKTGTLLATMAGHSAPVRSMLAADGALLSASEDRKVAKWDAKSGTLLAVLEGHGDEVMCMMTNAGELFTGSADTSIKHWDVASCKLQATWEGHVDAVTCLLSLNGTVFSGSRDRTIRQWDPKDGTLLATLEGHFHGVTCLLSAEGSLLSGSGDRTIRQWDPRDASLVATLEGRTGITCLLDCGEAFFSGLARGYPLRFPPPRMPPGELQRSIISPRRGVTADGEPFQADGIGDEEVSLAKPGVEGEGCYSPQRSGARSGQAALAGEAREVGIGEPGQDGSTRRSDSGASAAEGTQPRPVSQGR